MIKSEQAMIAGLSILGLYLAWKWNSQTQAKLGNVLTTLAPRAPALQPPLGLAADPSGGSGIGPGMQAYYQSSQWPDTAGVLPSTPIGVGYVTYLPTDPRPPTTQMPFQLFGSAEPVPDYPADPSGGTGVGPGMQGYYPDET